MQNICCSFVLKFTKEHNIFIDFNEVQSAPLISFLKLWTLTKATPLSVSYF